MEPDLPAQDMGDAPDMFPDEAQSDPALAWWGGLTNAERDAWADHVDRIIHLEDRDGKVIAATRREADIAREAAPPEPAPPRPSRRDRFRRFGPSHASHVTELTDVTDHVTCVT